MTPSDDVLDLVGDIDQHLSVAYGDLTVARRGFARCPSARRQWECEVAEAQVNELLDLRLALAGRG